jgi:hypothetical protein
MFGVALRGPIAGGSLFFADKESDPMTSLRLPLRRTLAAALTLAFLMAGPGRASAESLAERYPIERLVTLSDGRAMWLPLHVHAASGVMLAGLADLDKLRAHLAPHGLAPIAITPTRGLVALYNMHYEHTALGPYDELVILVAATRDTHPQAPLLGALADGAQLLAVYLPLLRGVLPNRDQAAFFTWKMFVTSALALRAGQDVWGFPKSLADVRVSVSAPRSAFEVRDRGPLVVRGARNGNFLQQATFPIDIDLYLATPRDIRATVSHAIADTQSRFDLFLGWFDDYEVNPHHPWGAALIGVGFTPLLWQSMPSLQAVFLAP